MLKFKYCELVVKLAFIEDISVWKSAFVVPLANWLADASAGVETVLTALIALGEVGFTVGTELPLDVLATEEVLLVW